MAVHATVTESGVIFVEQGSGKMFGPFDTAALISTLETARIQLERAGGKAQMFECLGPQPHVSATNNGERIATLLAKSGLEPEPKPVRDPPSPRVA